MNLLTSCTRPDELAAILVTNLDTWAVESETH